jgi:mycothiol synthase
VSYVISTPPALDAAQRAEVHALAAAVEARDRQPPLSDQALTQLGSPTVAHHLVRAGSRLVGYAQVDGGSAELAVAEPDALDDLLDAAIAPGTLVWSHGAGSALAPVLARRGFVQTRMLRQLGRPLAARPTVRDLPADVTVGPFVVGRDEDDWLRVNSAAFAGHPEQGGWTRADIDSREAEPWFDPDGFLLARRSGRLVGFHWTKIHSDGAGEVYVIGVDPSAQGLGLGPALLDRGLAYLHDRGCADVLLYVEDDNAVAMRLYERSGFSRRDVDVQWRAS